MNVKARKNDLNHIMIFNQRTTLAGVPYI